MNQTAVDYFEFELKDKLGQIIINQNWQLLENIIEQAKQMEAKQRQADTNHGYSQGYDDGAQGKEPMEPEISNPEGQSYQDKMRDKIAKAKSRLK
jgi:hypothetical protein